MALIREWPGIIGPGKMLRPRVTLGDDSPAIVSLNPNSGSKVGGTAVTITGTNFIAGGAGSADVTVTFADLLATSVVLVDRQTITCVTPAFISTGPVDVVVTIRGKSATLYGAFFVYETIITGVEPTHGPFGGGTSVLITGFNFKLGSTVTFGGVAATDVTWLDAEHIRCTTPAHAVGFVDVVVTEP